MTTLERTYRVVRGWHVLAALITFFLTVAAVDGVLMYKAVATFSGNDIDDAYRKGLAYNQTIGEEAAQSRLGWIETSSFDGANSRYSVSFADSEGHGVDLIEVTIVLGRPATNIFDRSIVLKPEHTGSYTADVSGLEEGAWTVTLSARKRDDPKIVYRARSKIWVQR